MNELWACILPYYQDSNLDQPTRVQFGVLVGFYDKIVGVDDPSVVLYESVRLRFTKARTGALYGLEYSFE